LAAINTKVDVRLRQRIVRLRQARSKEASLAGEQSACRSQIKLMYGSHHQQPQKDCRYDELDPYLVVREPSMHMIEPIHGQPPSGYHAPPNPNTLSHPTVDGGPCTLFVPTPTPGLE
jgi:hypothetical protein